MYYIYASDPHGTGQPWIDLVEKAQAKYPNSQTVFGGDYIDSNKFAKETVQFVKQQVEKANAVALIGNHELLMHDFVTIDDPLWLYNGGKTTIKSFFERGFSYPKVQKLLKHNDLYQFLIHLPTIYCTDHLIFVHAGLTPVELATPNFTAPIYQHYSDDPNWYAHTWIRGEYTFQPDSITFSHNLTNKTIVTGHTPTTYLHGVYELDNHNQSLAEDGTQAIETTFNDEPGHEDSDQQVLTRPCPVRKVQYQGESPKYYTDGGCHGHNDHHGNVCVFSENGQLVETFNSDPREEAFDHSIYY